MSPSLADGAHGLLANARRSGGESSGPRREHCDEFVDGHPEGGGRVVKWFIRGAVVRPATR